MLRVSAAITATSLGALLVLPAATSVAHAAPASGTSSTITVNAHWALAQNQVNVNLVINTTGSAAQPDTESWSDYVFAASTPCPQSVDALNQLIPDASGYPTGSTFSETTTAPGFDTGYPPSQTWLVSPDAAAHVCGYVIAGFPTNQITATTDSPVVRHSPHITYDAVMFFGRPGTATVHCKDTWGSTLVTFVPCQLRGRMVLSVSKKVRNQLGLTSRILASVTLKPYDDNQFYSPFKAPAKVMKAIGDYRVKAFPMTEKVTITSPTPTTFSATAANARRGVCGGTYTGVCKHFGG